MKRTVIFALVCALAFGVLASWLGPKMIAYWYAPPVPSGVASALNCTDAVTWAMNRLLWTQLTGSAAGALVGVVVGVLLGRRKAAAPPVSAPPKTS
jgi:ABC-type nitrate/sulfonate/bicarbonate transport system permease component